TTCEEQRARSCRAPASIPTTPSAASATSSVESAASTTGTRFSPRSVTRSRPWRHRSSASSARCQTSSRCRREADMPAKKRDFGPDGVRDSEALDSIWHALEANYRRLAWRWREGGASAAERRLAADLIEGKAKPRRPRSSVYKRY